jgi:Ser-tRNA(Ala) deacylase AlaX
MPTNRDVVLVRYDILYRTGMTRHHIFPELLKTTVSFPYSMLIEGERVTEKQKNFHLEIEKTTDYWVGDTIGTNSPPAEVSSQ